jgi:zinc finger homeobox protein 1/2
VINSNPQSEDEEDNQSEEEIEPQSEMKDRSLSLPPNLSLNNAKVQFEKMIQDKLVALSPSATTIIKLPTQPEPLATVVAPGTVVNPETLLQNGSPAPVVPSPIITTKKSEEHGTQTIYSCDQCDKTFTKKSSITRHKYEHSGTYTLLFGNAF